MKKTILLVGMISVFAAAAQAGQISGELERKPWSSTFWPLKKAWAAFGNWGQNLAPFEKYDNYVALTRGHNPGAAAREADPANGHNEGPDPKAESWTGHCHGWAPAALLEPEPPVETTVKFAQPVSFYELKETNAANAKRGLSTNRDGAYGVRPGGRENALEFATADMKAMLCEIYCSTKSTFHGTRYNGREKDRSNAAYMDVKPHLMHQLLVKYIAEKKQGLVFDADPSYMVWNQPVYKFDSKWTEGNGQLDVTTTVYWAQDSGIDPNFHGTEVIRRTYTYTMKQDASGNIVDSQWTGASIDDHPDFIWQPYGVVDENNVPGLSLEVVHEILANHGKTITTRNTGPDAGAEPVNPDPGTPTPENPETPRRGWWGRVRDGVRNFFGGN